MIIETEKPLFYEFADFRVDPEKHLLWRGEKEIALTPKVFETLLIFLEHHGEVLEKDRLMNLIWADSFVEESNLAQNVAVLRKALGENSKQHKFILTVPGRGYRFVAEVRKILTDEILENKESVFAETLAPDKIAEIGQPSSKNHRRFAFLTFACLALIGLSLAAYFLLKSKNTVLPPTNVRGLQSIAVLPFKPMSANDEDKYLGLGMADALIIKLGQLNRIIVRPTGNVRQYANQPQVDAVSAGQALRVEAVLEGTIQRTNDRIRVTVQLINVGDSRQIWADKFEEKSTDLFAVQDKIALRVANALTSQLTEAEQKKLAHHGTNNPEAFQLYVRGRFFANQETTEGFKKAVEHLNRAIELEPDYALAYTALSRAYVGASEWHLPPQEAMPKAKYYAEQALRLDETLPEAHACYGWVKMLYDWDWVEAESEFKRSLELNPNLTDTYGYYGGLLSLTGRHEEAIALSKRAKEINPLIFALSQFYLARKYDQAIALAHEAFEIHPNSVGILQWLGMAYEQKGQYDEAIATFQKARQIDDTPDIKAYQARAYALAGKRNEALKLLVELQELSKQRYVSPFYVALIYSGLGEKEQAFVYLEKAYQDKSGWIAQLKVNPQLDNLRNDPRFQDILKRIGFPE